MKNMLTEKEAELMGDLLNAESLICKKARLYSRTLSDPDLAVKLNELADSHEGRFNSLLRTV